jgi:hypothetical protein
MERSCRYPERTGPPDGGRPLRLPVASTRRASGDGARCENDRDSMTVGQKAQSASEQAAALLAGSLERHVGTCCQQNEQLRLRGGRGVLRKQAENAVEDTTERTAEREWEYAGDEDSGGSDSEDRGRRRAGLGTAASLVGGVQQNVTLARSALASA